MKIAERIVMVLILFCFTGGAAWLYFAVTEEQQDVRDAVARGEYQIVPVEPVEPSPDDWQTIYPQTVPMRIGSTTVLASVADTLPERILGLSNTPFLPDNVVKLFAFGAEGDHSIWMKDMKYPLDIMWADQAGKIVHIEENISPDTYPTSFSSPVLAWYVVEANAGFVAENSIVLGDVVAK